MSPSSLPPNRLITRYKGADVAVPDKAPHELRIRNSFREAGLRDWQHIHPECDRPLNWKWASCLPALGRLFLSTVYDMSELGGPIASRSNAMSYQTYVKPFFLFMTGPWRASGGEEVGVRDTKLPTAVYRAFKAHIDERVAAGEINSKTGYQYKGALTRILETIWNKDPALLGPGWSEREFVHDDFVDDNRQREPYSGTEARRILDATVAVLQEAVANGSAERKSNWLAEVACYTLIGLRLGIETECMDRLTVGSVIPHPDRNSITLKYLKRRAPSNPRRSKTVTTDESPFEVDEQEVGSLKSAGGVLALLLRRAQEAGRKADDSLWSQKFTSQDFRDFGAVLERRGLRSDQGTPLKINRTKFRVTFKSAQNVRHRGMLALMPEDNTRDVNARHYLESERLMPLYEQAIENAALEAMAYALERPKIVTLDENAGDADIKAAAAELDVPSAEVAAALRGETEVWIASCRDFYNSPFDRAGKACSKAFYGCLGCRNALITTRVLPRLLRFFSHIGVQRAQLSAADWQEKFGTAYRQITEEILPRFPKRVIDEARIIAQGIDATLHLPPELLA